MPDHQTVKRVFWSLALAFVSFALFTPNCKADERKGKMITIKGIIDSGLRNRVWSEAIAASRDGIEILIFDIQAAPSEFADSFALARQIAKIGGSVNKTVAFVNQPLAAHSVLVALACDEIVMSPDARLGDFKKIEDVGPTIEAGYLEIAALKQRPRWYVEAYLHPQLALLEVETATGKRILTKAQLEKEKDIRVLRQTSVKEAGLELSLDAAAAQKYGIAKLVVPTRRDVVAQYDLAESVAAEDALLREALRPILLRVDGSVDGKFEGHLLRRLKQIEAMKSNLVFVEINSTTGDLNTGMSAANALKSLAVRKVAWINKDDKVSGPALFLLFACDEVVMHPNASISGLTQEVEEKESKVFADRAVELTVGTKFPQALVRGLINRHSVVVQVQSIRNPASQALRTAEEMEDPEIKKLWANPRTIKEKGVVINDLDGSRARALDFASALANSEEELQARFDVAGDGGARGPLPVLKSGWMDWLIDALTSTEGTVLLLSIGLICLYLEIQMPGFAIAGIVSAICFCLFFWANYLSGTAGSLEIILFLLGLIFIALEVFVLPGFGVFGITGILLVVSSLIFASQSFVIPHSVLETRQLAKNSMTFAVSFVIFLVGAFILSRYLPQMPFFSRLMLPPPGVSNEDVLPADLVPEENWEEPVLHEEIVGRTGTAVTPLRPAGRVKIGDNFYDVVAQGEFVEIGGQVEVVEVHTARIIVRSIG